MDMFARILSLTLKQLQLYAQQDTSARLVLQLSAGQATSANSDQALRLRLTALRAMFAHQVTFVPQVLR